MRSRKHYLGGLEFADLPPKLLYLRLKSRMKGGDSRPVCSCLAIISQEEGRYEVLLAKPRNVLHDTSCKDESPELSLRCGRNVGNDTTILADTNAERLVDRFRLEHCASMVIVKVKKKYSRGKDVDTRGERDMVAIGTSVSCRKHIGHVYHDTDSRDRFRQTTKQTMHERFVEFLLEGKRTVLGVDLSVGQDATPVGRTFDDADGA